MSLQHFNSLKQRSIVISDGATLGQLREHAQAMLLPLGERERLHLIVYKNWIRNDDVMAIVSELLSDPRIRQLKSVYWETTAGLDVTSITSKFTDTCPDLVEMAIGLKSPSAMNFATAVVRSGSALKSFHMMEQYDECTSELFAALADSHVESFSAYVNKNVPFQRNLLAYLAKGCLTTLEVGGSINLVLPELLVAIRCCDRLESLCLSFGTFDEPLVLPTSVTRLELCYCELSENFNIVGPKGIRTLILTSVDYVNVRTLESTFCSLVSLELHCFGLANDLLASLDLCKLETLRLWCCRLNAASIALIETAVKSGRMRELKLTYDGIFHTTLLSAFTHPSCTLHVLDLTGTNDIGMSTYVYNYGVALGVLTILQGRQVRRFQHALRRMPLELVRMVHEMLIECW